MKRTRWVFGAAAVAGVVALVAPAVGQGKIAAPSGHLYWIRVQRLLLDPTFGSKGVVTVFPGTFGRGIRGIAVQPDGKIVVAGGTLLARYRPNGSPDPSFGTAGHVDMPVGELVFAVVLRPDGKIVAGGSSVDNLDSGSGFMLARYNPDGSLDTSFGTDGVTTTVTPGPGHYRPPSGCYDDCVRAGVDALAILPGGDIVAAGSTTASTAEFPTFSAFVLARYTPNGSLDPAFGDGGIVTTTFTGPYIGYDWFGGMVVLPSGKIVATGAGTGDGRDADYGSIELARYLPDGSLDPRFGPNGTGKVATSRKLDYYGGPPALQDGKIVVAGSDAGGTPVLARYAANGRLDTTFGSHGYARIPLGRATPPYNYNPVVVQANGKILIAVGTYVVRLLPDGRRDPSFVSLGDEASSLSLQANGRILVGGSETLTRLMGAGGGSTLTSYDFGAVDSGARAVKGFRLGTSALTKSGRLAISLTGSSAFSIASDRCTGKSIGKNLSCWVSVTYAPRGAPASDRATLRATGEHGAVASLSLSGSNTDPG